MDVTLDNREQFIELTKNKIYDIIVNEIKPQFNAFMDGFKRVIRPHFIKNITAE
jgi:ribosomal protein L17